MLAAIDPTTEVTTARNVKVAGRLAYELVLTPKTKGSKLTQVRIAIDGVTHSPLRVQVFGQGADPVFEVAYTAVDFSAPQAANFRFNPRAGVKVTEVPAGTADRQLPSGKTAKTSTGKRPSCGCPRPASPRSSVKAGPPSSSASFRPAR